MDIKKLFLDNPKTTIAGIVSALGYILPMLGIPLPANVANGILAAGLALVGIFAHDANNPTPLA